MSLGVLYIIATPIGNREDITLRALRLLREVNVIAAEDTRHSKLLLHHHHINTPLISLHAFNEAQRIPLLLERLQQGESVALISDAGTPLISDPGYLLVKSVRAANISVVPVPGACAVIAALSASGLDTKNFIFEGFLPIKSSERKKCLALLKTQTCTVVFYEAPHRIAACVADIVETLGFDREIVLAKELTKTFETFFCGTAGEALKWLQSDANHARGEFVVLVSGVVETKKTVLSEHVSNVLKILSEELPYSQAVALTARITGEKKNILKKNCFLLMNK